MDHKIRTAETARIKRAVVRMMTHEYFCYLSGVLQCGNMIIVDNTQELGKKMPTAWTDGWDTGYNLNYTSTLSDAELVGLVLHENLHKVYRHISRGKALCPPNAEGKTSRENNLLLALAADYVVNAETVDAQNKAPGVCALDELGYKVYDAKFDGWSFERVFRYLQRNKDDYLDKMPKDVHVSDTDGEEGNGEDNKAAGDKAQEAFRDSQIASALAQGLSLAKARSANTSSNAARSLADLVTPQVPWQAVISQWLCDLIRGEDIPTYTRLSIRSALFDSPMPSWLDETMDTLVIAVDTSGSVSDRELSVYLSEMAQILKLAKPNIVHLLYWDTKVCRQETYTRDTLDDMAKSTKPAGGGGTDLTCVPDYLRAKNIDPKVSVVFTDGYVGDDWGNWPSAVFIGVTSDVRCPYPHVRIKI